MGRLGLIRLKYVHAFRDRTGRMRYYFRRHGIRTALPGSPGSKEFVEAYAAGVGEEPKAVELRPAAAPWHFCGSRGVVLRIASVSIVVCNESHELPSRDRRLSRATWPPPSQTDEA
jgi:hypothetical protein